MNIDEIMQHPAVADFLETWGASCGAPRKVFTGHVRAMLKNILADAESESDVSRLAKLFGVPVEAIQMTESRFIAAEEERKRFYEDVVRPWVEKRAEKPNLVELFARSRERQAGNIKVDPLKFLRELREDE